MNQSGQKCAILYTIVENCRRLGINPKEYLTDVLTRLPAMLASEAASLAPSNWLKARDGKPVRTVACLHMCHGSANYYNYESAVANPYPRCLRPRFRWKTRRFILNTPRRCWIVGFC